MNTRDALLQLVSVGVVWMAVHCVGMCGPLLTGLDVGGAARGAGLFTSAARMVQYQGGRAITYASLGALAGALGGGLARVSSVAGAVLAVALGLIALWRARAVLVPRRRDLVTIGVRGDVVTRTMARVRPLLLPVMASTSPWRPALLGVALGFLPCMIALWALGLAALTGSAAGGALVMLGLVVMTTPVVVLIGTVARSLRAVPSAWRAKLPGVLLAVSGLWLILVGLAGVKLIAHVHVPLAEGFTLMLF